MKNLLIIFLIFYSVKCLSQNYELRTTPYLESEIVFKDGSREEGLVRMGNSVFDVRFKSNTEGKEKKIPFKEIEQIRTNRDSAVFRIFEYRETYKDKLKAFVELIHQDEVSIYLGAKDGTRLFYSGMDTRSAMEAMTTYRIQKSEHSLRLSNGMKILLPLEYHYDDLEHFSTTLINKGDIEAYLGITGKKLIPIERRKRFSKKYLRYFSDCPTILEAYETGELDLENLPVFIETYKKHCGSDRIWKRIGYPKEHSSPVSNNPLLLGGRNSPLTRTITL